MIVLLCAVAIGQLQPFGPIELHRPKRLEAAWRDSIVGRSRANSTAIQKPEYQ